MSGTESVEDPTAAQRPLLRVVSGNPTPEELAALVAVVAAAASAAGSESADEPLDAWSAPSAMHRTPMPPPGPGAWSVLGQR